jgi:hypothetical protein
MLVDFENCEAGMLLVIGAEPAIIGTAEFRGALQSERAVARLDVVLAELPVRRIG